MPHQHLLLANTLLALTALFIFITWRIKRSQVALNKSWHPIEVLMKTRFEALPRYLNAATRFMQYEKPVLDNVSRANQVVFKTLDTKQMEQISNAETSLRASLAELISITEAYPELRRDSNLTHLMAQIIMLENSILDRSKEYNERVDKNNTLIKTIGFKLMAKALGAKQKSNFHVKPEWEINYDLKALFR